MRVRYVCSPHPQAGRLVRLGEHLLRGGIHVIQTGSRIVEANQESAEDTGEWGRYIERLSGQPQRCRVELQDHLMADLVGLYHGSTRNRPANLGMGELQQGGLHVANNAAGQIPHVPTLQVDSDGMLVIRIVQFGYQYRCQQVRR
jgi:hypothetical protein